LRHDRYASSSPWPPAGKNSVTPPPVIAIDGPAASGKGTVAQGVAAALRLHYLDSGSLYRLVALKASREGIATNDEARLAAVARSLEVAFDKRRIRLEGLDVTEELRGEPVSGAASRIAVLPSVRLALLSRQRSFRRPPGLVADGRDMGTVVFPDAALKIYLMASAEVRAERRYKQLIEKGNSVTLEGLLHDIRERDARDSARAAAPLKAAADALILDTTELTIASSIAFVLERAKTLIRPVSD
jgi:cytidylate kinase